MRTWIRGGGLVLAILWPGLSGAVDGVIEISQAKVLEAAGFPYAINEPGAYRLTSNLDLRGLPDAENLRAIIVNADGVSIDLNGFSIIGPTVCTGIAILEPVTCTPSGSGRGISSGADNMTVMNGAVRGVGGNGVHCGSNCRVERLHVESCGGSGIQGQTGGVILANTSHHNGGAGIHFVTGSAVIRENTVSLNGAEGIYAGANSTVSNNTSTFNRLAGIGVSQSTGVIGNSILNNRGDGVSATGTSAVLVRDNAIQLNGGWGINFGGSNGHGYGGNVLSANTLGGANGGIQLGPNLCTTALCP